MSDETTPDAVAPESAMRGGRTQLEVIRTTQGMWGNKGSGDTSGFGGLEQTWAMPSASARPYGSWFDEVVDVLVELRPRA